jgi:LacI family transcriptional regulator
MAAIPPLSNRKTTGSGRQRDSATPAPIYMADLARELGLSTTTISRALSNHYSIGASTKQRVLKLAKKLHYQPNQVASALRKGQSRLLGVVVPYIEGKFFPAVIKAIEQATSKAGFSVIVCQSHEDGKLERRSIETLLCAQVAGVLVSLASGTSSLHHFAKVTARNIPLVFFDRVPTITSVNAVVLDDRVGAAQAVQHLLAQGCRRIAHLAGPLHLNIYRQRYLGYQEALLAHGLPLREELIIHSDMTLAAGARAAHQLLGLAHLPDGVFSAGDIALLGLLQTVKRQGIKVPDQLALAGFSNEGFTTLTEPQLTSVDQRCAETGTAAVDLLLEMATAPSQPFLQRQVLLRPELCIRSSSLRLATTLG